MSQVTSNIKLNVDSSQVEVAKRITGLLADETERAASAAERWNRAVTQGASAMVAATAGGKPPGAVPISGPPSVIAPQPPPHVDPQPPGPPKPPPPRPTGTQQQPWFKRGLAGELYQTGKIGIGVALGEGLIGMFREAITEARDYQEILSKIGSTLGNQQGIYRATRKEMNLFAGAYSLFQEESAAVVSPLLGTQGNIGGIRAVGDVDRVTGLAADRVAPLYGRMRFLTRGGASSRPRERMSRLMGPAFAAFGPERAGLRGPQVGATLEMINAAQTQGYMLSEPEQDRISAMMGTAAQISPAYAGAGGARLLQGMQSGIQSAQGGVASAMLVRAGMDVGEVTIGGEKYDLRNPYHLKRFREAGLLRTREGMEVVKAMFNRARGYGKDAGAEILHRTFGGAVSYQDITNLWDANGQFSEQNYSALLSEDPQVERRLESYKNGPGAQRGVTVGAQLALRETGDMARKLHNEFVTLVSGVANASGTMEKFSTAIEGLIDRDWLRRFFEGNLVLQNPTITTTGSVILTEALLSAVSGGRKAVAQSEMLQEQSMSDPVRQEFIRGLSISRLQGGPKAPK